MTRSIIFLVAAIAGLATGCAASHTARPTGSVNDQGLVALRSFAGCVRAHGLPSFPDPVLSRSGVPQFPENAPSVTGGALTACREVAARIPPQYTETAPVSASDFQKLRVLARCVRAHGVPDWPDPNSLGQFPIPSRIETGGKTLFIPAVHACARLNPDPNGGIHVVRAR
ncbi:MAG TPA: hypothetical protein VH210_14685 [Gaiellaceae bacterium]|jgi:hypothetical protein|nr:hypothetical protein [Gaiellaceae bacterium]